MSRVVLRGVSCLVRNVFVRVWAVVLQKSISVILKVVFVSSSCELGLVWWSSSRASQVAPPGGWCRLAGTMTLLVIVSYLTAQEWKRLFAKRKSLAGVPARD